MVGGTSVPQHIWRRARGPLALAPGSRAARSPAGSRVHRRASTRRPPEGSRTPSVRARHPALCTSWHAGVVYACPHSCALARSSRS